MKTIGRYQIKAELGRGGMAVVYRAFDPKIGREVALKLMSREFLADPEFHQRFEREARAIGALLSQAIVPLYDFGEDKEQPYLVMRLMTGGSLMDKLQRGPLSLEEASELLNRLAEALDEAHAKGIIHRDLKPGNILLDHKDLPYLADFGIVKMLESNSTNTRGTIGTPAYMSPEHFDGHVTALSDIYALGVILFQVLTGQLPFKANTPTGWLKSHMIDKPLSLRQLNKTLPAAIEPIMERALAKQPEKRYQSAGELALAVRQLIGAQSTQPNLTDGMATLMSQTISSSFPIENPPPTMSPEPVATTMPPEPVATTMPPEPVATTARPYRFWWVVVVVLGIGAILAGGMWSSESRKAAVAALPTATPQPQATWTATATPPPAATWTATPTPVLPTNTPLPTVTPLPPSPTATATATLTPLPPTATVPPTSQKIILPTNTPTTASKRAAIGLEAPPSEASFTGRDAAIELHWSETSPSLVDDEYYVLMIRHKGGEDRTWLKTNHYAMAEKEWLVDQGPDLVWQVVVAQKRTTDPNEDPRGAERSEYSEQRKLIWGMPGSGGQKDTNNNGGSGGGGIN